MTAISNEPETLASGVGPDKTRQRRSQRIVKRKRSFRLMIKRRLHRMLRPRKIFRKLWVLLPLVGFVYVSLMNVVLDPGDEATNWIKTETRAVNGDGFIDSDVETKKSIQIDLARSDDRPAVAKNNSRQTDSVTFMANSWSTVDLDLSTLWPYEADGTSADLGSGKSLTSDTASTGSIVSKSTYVVNEGGSLWRTSRLFIDDEILQDKLIDNLAESGMDVHSVRAGTEFFVNDLGSEGLLVVIENGGDTYESHIVENKVTTTVRR